MSINRVVAIVRWLRDHPAVEAGPSVRASQAVADLAVAWRTVTGSEDLLPAALLALPHRMRVRAGVDPEELVRQAVAGVEKAFEASGRNGDGEPDGEGEGENLEELLLAVAVGLPSTGALPERTHEERAVFTFTEDEARRLLADLLDPGSADPTSSGPAPTHPGRRALDAEVLSTRPFRAGDRSRDLSVRQTVRAALRHGGRFSPPALRALARQPSARWDVAFVLDTSASMGRAERPLVAPATTALAGALLRDGHRVAALAFSEEALIIRGLSRSPAPLETDGYAFSNATNTEAGLDAGRLLLGREAAVGARRHVVLVSDAETTSHNGSDEAWGPLGAPRGPSSFSRLYNGEMVDAARRAALLAATRCRRAGITVSVVYPDDRADVAFAHQLAAAGGGQARCLRPD